MQIVVSNMKSGVKACLANSERLLEEAKVLFKSKSYLSCFFLIQLSQKELCKLTY
jgi:AbiV family abortive infection protein